MSLHTADPGGSGANEVGSGVGYTRVEVTNAFPPAISPRLSNNVAITFPVATSQYVVTHIGFWESSTEILPDCFLYSQELAAPVTVAVGAPFSLAVGSVAIFSR